MRAPRPSTLASLSYFVAAAIPVGAWAIMLLVATPEGLSVSQAVVEQLQYTFAADNSDRWWFITWALAPVVLLLLSASYVGGPPRRLGVSWVLLTIGAAVTLASTYLWPSVFPPSAVGVYCAFRARSDAKPS
jgi:cytochrome bd-type quinol oxidase subunit 2